MQILDALIEADELIDEIDGIVTDQTLTTDDRVAKIDRLLAEYRAPQ